MVFNWSFYCNSMKIDPGEFNLAFEGNVKRRFQNAPSIKIRRVDSGYKSDCTINWPYQGIEYKCNFYVNGEKRLNFFIELEFERRDGLREKLEEALSGSKMEKLGFLNRPHREYFNAEKKEFHKHHVLEEQKELQGLVIDNEKISEGSIFKEYVDTLENNDLIRKEKDYYFISCRIKRIPNNLNVLINSIFGSIISPIYDTITNFSKEQI